MTFERIRIRRKLLPEYHMPSACAPAGTALTAPRRQSAACRAADRRKVRTPAGQPKDKCCRIAGPDSYANVDEIEFHDLP
ncbi:hypothetical protein GSbR_24330 [Geobacter sp. SVR]|nr:hypothetical protein GSVR_26160 [Geobacter sp. SVR]GCF85833.1 hypothetical protein GSbR_24330 [Geobacter sp. SVR]